MLQRLTVQLERVLRLLWQPSLKRTHLQEPLRSLKS